MERAIMTGITRISKESIFSDLNNLEVVTTTSKKYADCFGFTESEVFETLKEYGLSDQKQSPEIKMTLERLLRGETFSTTFDEQTVFNQLGQSDDTVWSLLLASGYLRALHYKFNTIRRKAEFELKLTNTEVHVMFEQIIEGWFEGCRRVNNAFLQALMTGDIKGMNTYMNKVALQTFSYFDTGKRLGA